MSDVGCQREFCHFAPVHSSYQHHFAAVHNPLSHHHLTPSLDPPNVNSPHLLTSHYLFPTKLPDPKVIQQVISEIDPVTHLKILSQISVPIEELIRPTTKSRKSGGGIPRPQNLFVLYRRDLQAKLTAKFGPEIGSHLPFVSKEASEGWKMEAQEVKNIYEFIAELAKKVHELTYPNYVYKPRKRALKSALNRSMFDNELYRLASRQRKDSNDDLSETSGNGQNDKVALGVHNMLLPDSHISPTHNQPHSQRRHSTPHVLPFQLPRSKHNYDPEGGANDRYGSHQQSSPPSQYQHSGPSSRSHAEDTSVSVVGAQRNLGRSRQSHQQQRPLSVWPVPRKTLSNHHHYKSSRNEGHVVSPAVCVVPFERSIKSANNLSPSLYADGNGSSSSTDTSQNFTTNYVYPSPTVTQIKDLSATPPLTSRSLSRSTSFASSSACVPSPTLNQQGLLNREFFEIRDSMYSPARETNSGMNYEEREIERRRRHSDGTITSDSYHNQVGNDETPPWCFPVTASSSSSSFNLHRPFQQRHSSHPRPRSPNFPTAIITPRDCGAAPQLPPLNTFLPSESSATITGCDSYDRKMCRSFGGPV
ncbi:1181_t:CDS:1 [Acaulospora colombiana]|uniref:1181_t:CDS:1 n=1 Tax=Acaulospora colombiana TaxID=27376 RepID=A0ACA9K4I9_9GLOM|nr:1181_t:CDS:1 [Acaulospora colombiana]